MYSKYTKKMCGAILLCFSKVMMQNIFNKNCNKIKLKLKKKCKTLISEIYKSSIFKTNVVYFKFHKQPLDQTILNFQNLFILLYSSGIVIHLKNNN